MHSYLFLAYVLFLNQGCQYHIEAVVRESGTFHDVSDDAVTSVVDDVIGHVNRNFFASSDYCAEILEAYGLAASDYIRCIVLHAREFKKCRACCGHYIASDELYRNITETQSGDSGSSCFANPQQMELVALSQVNDFIQTSWKTSLCSYCFVDPSANGSHSSQLNDRTSDFFRMLSIFHDCLLNNTQGDIDPFIDRSNGTGNLSVICHECKSSYSQLNDFYKKLEDKDTPICSDMENLMNLSHSLWNDLCHKVVYDVTSMVIVGVLAFIPLFFYIITAVKGKHPDRMFLRQKRWEHVMLVSEPGTTRLVDSDSQP